jgi:uncharacterized repeat protein (TIGR04052 family)
MFGTRMLAALGGLGLLGACATPVPEAAAPGAPREIRFAATVAGTPFACGMTASLGQPAVAARPTDFRFFVTDVALLRADGTAVPFTLTEDGIWQRGGVALLDFEDGTGPCATGGSAATNTALRGTAPAGTYAGLRFTLGVPERLNHQDATIAQAPFNTTAMFWNWQNGYKFLKLDLSVAGTPSRATAAAAGAGHHAGSGFAVHLGSTQCAAEAPTRPGRDCLNPNRPVITLTGFDPLQGTVGADPAPVLAASDLRRNTPRTPPGCMSFPGDPECNQVLPRLGLPYGTTPAGRQVLFSARP